LNFLAAATRPHFLSGVEWLRPDGLRREGNHRLEANVLIEASVEGEN
jgi:hypothetical protein